MALIYLFRTGISFGPNIAHAMPVNIGGEQIGNFWQEQYIYYYAHPFTLVLKAQDGASAQYAIQAGNTYYFIFDHEVIQNNPYWRQLNDAEGRELLKDYKLSGDFKKIIFEYGKENTPLTPTENNRLIAAKHIQTSLNKSSSLNYDEQSRVGRLSYKTDMRNRNNAFQMIEEICNTKNIAIKTGGTLSTAGASYKTLDEQYKDYSYHIKFKCLY